MESADGKQSAPAGMMQRLRALAGERRALTALVLMAIVGVGISIYLTTIHYAQIAPICTTGGIVNCSSVLKSSYSNVPGTTIPITVPGLFWFVVSGALAVVGLRAAARNDYEPDWLLRAQLIWSALGMVVVLYLVYAEIVVLHRICEWCTAVHLLTLASLLVVMRREPVEPVRRKSRPAAPAKLARQAESRPAAVPRKQQARVRGRR